MLRKTLLTAILFAPALHAQDTRTVTEPTIPAICTTLTAQLPAPLAEADETKLDTARIQHALDHCPKNHAVALTAAGPGTAFSLTR